MGEPKEIVGRDTDGCGIMNIGPVLKYPGSKWRMADWIIANMPKHGTYLEPYLGSGAVFFTKRPSTVETINDIDRHIVDFFKVLREHPDELARVVELTPWSRLEYETYLTSSKEKDYFLQDEDPIENARRLLIRMNMGFGSRSSDMGGWKHNVQTKGCGNSSSSLWKNIPKRIYLAAQRLKDAQIECRPAVEVIGRYRYQDVLIYADPPYPLSTRHNRIYKHEMTDQDHIELLGALDRHPGPVLLSGYGCELYDSRLTRWTRKTFKAFAEGGREREEVLWINPAAAKSIGTTLF